MSSKEFLVVGLTHVDLAWIYDSTHYAECMENALVRILDLLESDPSFTYVIEQIAHYRALARSRPDLVERLRKFVEEGRVEQGGAMASSIDTNGPNGESIVRNHLLGRKWVRENLGAEVKVGNLIDTFGLCAQMPQIHKQLGMSCLLANRFGGSVHESLFKCKGLDGSTILIAGQGIHAPYVKPGRVHYAFLQGRTAKVDRLFEGAATSECDGPNLVLVYDENENQAMGRSRHCIARNNNQGNGIWKYSFLQDFFAAVEKNDIVLKTIDGDLNPGFSGRYSLRPSVRLRNRSVETLLIEAEKWAVLKGLDDWKRDIDDAWWFMSYVQSHDVYTGSFPTEVLHETNDWLDQAQNRACSLLDRALGKQVSECDPESETLPICVCNGLPWQRRDIATCDMPKGWQGVSAITHNGQPVPCEVREGRIEFLAETPAVGTAGYTLTRGESTPEAVRCPVERATIENEFLRLECSSANGIKRIVSKASGKDLAANCGGLLVAQQDMGSFRSEDPVAGEVPAEDGTMQIFKPRVSELGQCLVISGSFPRLGWAGPDYKLNWELELTLRPGKPQLHIRVKLDWRGEATRIRLHVPTMVKGSMGVFEIPFGTVKREPYSCKHWAARGEWPAHRFASVEDDTKGVALVNNGTMGVEFMEGHIRTTLLRAPANPTGQMKPDDTSSAHGAHVFDFSLVPYRGSLAGSTVIAAAQEHNNPLLVRCAEAEGTSMVSLSPGTCVLSAVKAPEDGSRAEILVRLYESSGKETKATLTVAGTSKAWKSNLLEEKLASLPCVTNTIEITLKPYEILTIRIARASRDS